MTDILYGRQPVYEVLRARRRAIRRVLLAEGVRDAAILAQITDLAAEQGLPIEYLPRQHLTDLAGTEHHQGTALEGAPYPCASIDDALALAADRAEPPLFLLLDLLQDVHNVGSLLRTAEAVGVHGVVLQERRAAGITPAVVNASAGAVEHLLVAQVTNLVRAMGALKEADVWLAGLESSQAAIRYDQADLSGPLGLVVGSEGEGLRPLVRETCDFLIQLPMRGRVGSLNAAIAGSIALYAAWAARGFA
jgi:23S rRNA (guanosine2251-2'-O)-methyltransferase